MWTAVIGRDMEFPDSAAIRRALDPDTIELPEFARVRYEPETPTLDDVASSARAAVKQLPVAELQEGASVAVGMGSRGITDIETVARAVLLELTEQGLEPVVVPAMGSHGGATADGQRRTLAGLNLTESTLGCPVDARMGTRVVGHTPAGDPVHLAEAACETDAVLVINRVKPHTNFRGRIESGLCKMLTVGLGKQPGAKRLHDRALTDGYVPTIEAMLEVLKADAPPQILGGVGIVENFADETAYVDGIAAADLPDAEEHLLERARDCMATLPYDRIDVLVVDRIGKDVSGTGMDTNVIGRYRVLNTTDPASPDIKRIVIRGLTEATHGNAQGIGLADIVTQEAVEQVDLAETYTNALTSASLSRAKLPVVLPDDRCAVGAALSTIGPYDPDNVRLVWIRDTSHLTEFHVSTALLADSLSEVEPIERLELTFPDGDARFTPP